MKRLLPLILALLVLAVLPVTALASNDYYYGTIVSTPEELENALLAPEDEEILIAYDFTWGEGDKVLIIDIFGNEKSDYGRDVPSIKFLGPWTIPEDWTVILYESLRCHDECYECDITVNGTLTFMDRGYIQPQGWSGSDELVVNGTLTTSATDQTQLSGFNSVVVNGTFENPYRCTMPELTVNKGATMTIGNTMITYGLNLPDGIHLTGGQLTMYGDLTVDGAAKIDNDVDFFEDATITGEVYMDWLRNRNLTIPAGSYVHTNDLRSDGYKITVGGTLSVAGSYIPVTNTEIWLDGGTMILNPWIQFSGSDSGSTITGDGTLKLYAEYNSRWDTYNGYPRIFGLDADEGISEHVASTVTVWRNWSDCIHQWVDTGKVVEPDCYNEGYTLFTCAECGLENRQNIIPATGDHELSYAPSEYEDEMYVSCSKCGETNRVIIYVESYEVEFEGVPVKNAHVYCDGYLLSEEDMPQIMYINNDMEGATATAFAEIGGITISVQFQLVGCSHEVGTPATCMQPAICSKCGGFFGRTADHTWGDTLVYNETNHYYVCTVEGCGAFTTSEEEMFMLLPPVLVEKWAILMEMGYVTGGGYVPLNEHIYEEGSSCCAICGFGGTATGIPGDMDGDGVLDDKDVAQLLWHTLFPDSYEIAGNADFTGDGQVDDADVAYLLWHTLFPEKYPI